MNTEQDQLLNELAASIHKRMEKWWQDPRTQKPIERNKEELLMLSISELSEAMEGERKNLMDDKLPHRKMAEVEMADAYIRLCDFSAGFKYQLSYETGRAVFIPKNKAAAIFKITTQIVRVGECLDSGCCNVTISHALELIRAYCIRHNYDLAGAIEEKMEFNRTREDHKHEARLIAGGKQF